MTDLIAVHVVETTASSGAQFQATPWAQTWAYLVVSVRARRANHLWLLAMQARLRRSKLQ